MTDIGVPDRLSDRLESLFGKRRDGWTIVVLLLSVVAIVLALRLRSPSPEIAPPAVAPRARDHRVARLEGKRLFVHVAGAVRKPGLYRLPEGSRVADAIEAAGGAAARADVDAVNLAEPLLDGAKVDVPRRGGVPPQAPTATATSAPTAAPAVVDLNTADAAALEAIPGIGPVRAAAILQYRDENGPFPSVDALLDVSGIGPATLETVRPYVRV